MDFFVEFWRDSVLFSCCLSDSLLFAASLDGWRWHQKTFCRRSPTSLTICLLTASTTGDESSPSMHSLAGWLGTAAAAEHVMHRPWTKSPAVIRNLPGRWQSVPANTWPGGYQPGYGNRVDGWVIIIIASSNSSSISSDLMMLIGSVAECSPLDAKVPNYVTYWGGVKNATWLGFEVLFKLP